MSLKTADDVYVKDEPCSDLPNEYEPASALAANTWQDVKAEGDSETCGESDVARLYTECDEDERAQSLVDLVKAEEQSESACLSEDEGQYIKEEVKEELELGPTVFLRPRVTFVCQESSQDKGTKKPDTESVSSGVLGHQKTRDEASPYKIHTEVKPFKCTQCTYSFRRKWDLNRHERIHTGDKPFKCGYCTFSCTQKYDLNRHERIHTGHKPFKCTHCSYSCVRQSSLKIHETIHTGDKPYKCTYCTYSCVQKGNLKIHVRIHTGEKPYKCTYCSYRCANKSHLKLHETIHGSDKPYQCAHCKYSSRRKMSLKAHLILSH